MKSIRKIISLLLCVSLLWQSAVFSYADTNTAEYAKALYDLGLFNGMNSTEYAPNLEGYATREQAMKMLIEIFRWEVDETATTDFIDVSDWAEPYVATAVSKGVTNGMGVDDEGNNIFGAQDGITARQLETWYDRIITGSTTAWEDNGPLDNVEPITRGYMIDVTYAALSVWPTNGTMSIIESIVGDDEELLKIAIEKGLITVEQEAKSNSQEDTTTKEETEESKAYTSLVKELDVADDDKIVITFLNELDDDSAEKDDYYTLMDEDYDEVNDLIDELFLSDDDEVTITFEKELSGEFTLLIDGVKDLEGNTVYEVIDFEVDNGKAATIEDVEVVYYDEILLTFSEDIEETSAEDDGNYELHDEDGYEVHMIIDDVKMIGDDQVTITFTEYLSGEYTLEVEDVEDLYEDSMDDEYDFEVDGYLAIDEATLISGTEIEVTFTADIDDFDIDDFIIYTDEDSSGDYDDDKDDEMDIDTYILDEDDNGYMMVTIILEDEISTGGYQLQGDGDVTDDQVRITTETSDIETVSKDGDNLKKDNDHELEDEMIPEFVDYYAVDQDGNNQIDAIIAEYTEAIDDSYLSKSTYDVDGYSNIDVYVDDVYQYLVIIEIEESGKEDLDEEPKVEQQKSVYDLSGNKLEEQSEEKALSANDKDNYLD